MFTTMGLAILNSWRSRADDPHSIAPRTLCVKLARLALASLPITAAIAAPAHAQLPYGPDTCSQGYVWREAFPGDHVCVRPEVRAQAAADNAAGPSRRQPGGGAFGPDTCLQDFVWRDARPGDHVCVPPATRDQAATDNRLAGNRLASDSGDVFTFDRPRYGDDRLDWCLTWGADCGQPAALEFCHRRRFDNVQGFGPEKVLPPCKDEVDWNQSNLRGGSLHSFLADYLLRADPLVSSLRQSRVQRLSPRRMP